MVIEHYSSMQGMVWLPNFIFFIDLERDLRTTTMEFKNNSKNTKMARTLKYINS
jgi:hypothetical protein